MTRQNYAIAEIWQRQEDVNDLKTKLALAEQELKNKELLLQEKEGRIMDLQKTILLLEAPKKEVENSDQKPIEKKKKWWLF